MIQDENRDITITAFEVLSMLNFIIAVNHEVLVKRV